MKISILSMQRVLNYGSVLQAYGLKRVVENIEGKNDVDFIDVEVKSSEKKKKKITFDKLKKINKYIFKQIRFKKNEEKVNEKILDFQKKELNLSNTPIYRTDSDLTIIGSDEVFNCDPKCAWGVSTQLFGNIQGCNNVISYAASAGYTKINDLSENEKNILKNASNNLKYISVRDNNTFEFIKELTGKEPKCNLDPVLIYGFDEEVKSVEANMNLEKDYLIVYSYTNRIKDKNEIEEIKKFAKENNLKIYCVQGLLPWCDEFKEWSPFEVMAGFKNAKYIITDTFHGCVISAKYNKNFAVLIRDSNRNKIGDLLNRLDLESQKVENIKDLETILKKSPSYEQCNKIIKEEKINTKDYLKKAIQNI